VRFCAFQLNLVLENASRSIMFKLVAIVGGHRRRVIALVLVSLLVLVGSQLHAKFSKSAITSAPSSKLNRAENATPSLSNGRSTSSPYLNAKFLKSGITPARSSKLDRAEDATLSRSTDVSSTRSPSSSTALNVVLPGSFHLHNETFKCLTARIIGMKFPICVYAANIDIYLSASFVGGGYFERDEVSRFLRLLQLDRRLQFVDVGANVGVFSLPIARLTHVLAVEPNWQSMARLMKAVDLGAVSSNITLVHNAVSNVRTALKMGVDKKNQGHAYLIDGTECKETDEGRPCSTLAQTKTVLLNDLLPLMRSKAALLKVDVEGHEIKIFTESSAGQFFDQIDVSLVFMEWMWCKKMSPVIVNPLLDFFRRRNYVAFDTRNIRLQTPYRNWPGNILFKKSSYIPRF